MGQAKDLGLSMCVIIAPRTFGIRRTGEPGLQEKGGWDALLARYLRAEKYNAHKAEKRLREHAVWRTNFCPKGQFTEVSPVTSRVQRCHEDSLTLRNVC